MGKVTGKCMPPRLDTHFARIDHLADPMQHMDNHCKSSDEFFGTVTSEEHMPSLKTGK